MGTAESSTAMGKVRRGLGLRDGEITTAGTSTMSWLQNCVVVLQVMEMARMVEMMGSGVRDAIVDDQL